jgi:uncharacterized membrane protein YphA (DoxX/SURF4 family)
MERDLFANSITRQNGFFKIISFSWLKKSTFLEIICLLFILLFVYAAINKLSDYQKFTVQLGKSPLLTDIAGIIAWFIPTIEIIIAILLSFSRTSLLGLYASFSLMVMFTAYIIAITQFSSFVPCSCGGVLQKMTWNQHLVFNIAFVLLAMYGIILKSKNANVT